MQHDSVVIKYDLVISCMALSRTHIHTRFTATYSTFINYRMISPVLWCLSYMHLLQLSQTMQSVSTSVCVVL